MVMVGEDNKRNKNILSNKIVFTLIATFYMWILVFVSEILDAISVRPSCF